MRMDIFPRMCILVSFSKMVCGCFAVECRIVAGIHEMFQGALGLGRETSCDRRNAQTGDGESKNEFRLIVIRIDWLPSCCIASRRQEVA